MAKKEDLQLFKRLSSNHNLNLNVLYTYNLKNIKKSNAVRFVYLLKGRSKEKGIIKEFKGTFLAPGCFIIPIKHDKEMQEIFTTWKIPYKRKLILTH
ncbi:hypothetical protein GF336_07085 [Candidatus Woesearchaeota archaeon]|nr:hypothetical protein [Candidatus Woesearchaeota archaeon]